MKAAAILTNYNMPERANALAEHIKAYCPCDLYVVDNGSDIAPPSLFTNVWIKENCQTTGGWLEGLRQADRVSQYDAYWFLITSASLPDSAGDVLSPMLQFLADTPEAVGIHPALTPNSTTSWEHLITRGGDKPRRTWMIDNIASLYRADWFNAIGRFDERMIYGWGIDLETCYLARRKGRSLWVDERVRVEKITNIGYAMDRMNMTADDRSRLAGDNMRWMLRHKYGPNYWDLMMNEGVENDWR